MNESDIGGSGRLELENEGEIITDPTFLCELCGFANVRFIDIGDRSAAKCTNCGAGYLHTDNDSEATDGD